MKKNFVLFLLTLTAAVNVQAQVINQQRSNDYRTPEQYQSDCAAGISVSSCGPLPIANDCVVYDPNSHFTNIGSGIAHCVKNDMNCPSGTTLVHDGLGNPSCAPIICPPDQVLYGNSCIPKLPPLPSPPIGTGTFWTGYIRTNTPCNKKAGTCNENLAAKTTQEVKSKVSEFASINPLVVEVIRLLDTNCINAMAKGYLDNNNISFTRTSPKTKVAGACDVTGSVGATKMLWTLTLIDIEK